MYFPLTKPSPRRRLRFHKGMGMRSRRFRTKIEEAVADLLLNDSNANFNDEELTYSLHRASDQSYHLLVNGRSFNVFLVPVDENVYRLSVNGKTTELVVKGEREMLLEQYGLEHGAGGADSAVRAPMPGLVLSTLVSDGDLVSRGDGLVVLEAMKMENEIRSTADGRVKHVHVEAGDAVGKDTILVDLE